MAVAAAGLLVLAGFTIFLGYIGSLIFEKTRIPDVVWLLLFGLLVGPVFNLVNVTLFLSLSGLLSAIAILIILFDAGLNMDFFTMIKEFSRATALAILGIGLTMIVVGAVSMYLFNFDILTGLLLGAIIGGTSSPIVISMVSGMQIREHVKTVLQLESVLTDPICIVVSIALIQIITFSLQNSIAHDIIASFSIGIVIGSLAGLIWLSILHALRKRPFGYMLTLAMLLLLYVFVESIAASGAIAALFFGLVLGNGRTVTRFLRFKTRLGIKPFIKTFHKEMSFFIRSFFFVYLGLIVKINPTYLLYGVGISAILILLRLVIVHLSMFKSALSVVELNMMRIMTPRGLAAAVLAQLPLQYGIVGGNIISNIVFIVILCTVIYASVATRFVYSPPTHGPATAKEKEVTKVPRRVSKKIVKKRKL